MSNSSIRRFVDSKGNILPMLVYDNGDGLTYSLATRNGKVPTYGVAVAAFAPVASATDILSIVGAPGLIVRVLRIAVSGKATAAGEFDFLIVKRSTADTAGTPTIRTGIPHDSADAAAQAVVNTYAAVPTPGTLIGTLRAQAGTLTTGAGAIPVVPTVFEFGRAEDKEAILRTAAESIALNLNAVTVTGGSLDLEIVWSEEPV